MSRPWTRTRTARGAGAALLVVLVVAAGLYVHRRLTRPVYEHVVLRLAAADFSLETPGPHLPVVPVGEDARTVIAAPQTIRIVPERAVTPVDGVVRVTTSLQARGRVHSPDGLVVSMRGTTPPRPMDAIAYGAEVLHWKVVDDWRLERASPRADAIAIEVHGIDPAVRVAQMRVDVQLPTPTVLVSRPFDPPPGARLEVAWALAHVPRRARPVEVTFQVDLLCREGKRVLAVDTVAVTGDVVPPWRDRVLSLPPDVHDCRLRLFTASQVPAVAPVWTVPVVVADGLPPASPGVTPVPAPRNLVMISLDTLRADHLSGYGYVRQTSPEIDARLIARGTTFEDVSTTFPLTNVAHMGLFSGLYPESTRGVGDGFPMLAETLRDAGFHTAAFTEDALLAGVFGFWHGFDRFTERPFVGAARGRDTFRDGADFLRTRGGRPFFLFLHTYKVHAPYESGPASASLFAAPGEWTRPGMDTAVPAQHRADVDAYDRAIREADDQVAAFLDVLDALHLADETLVVLLSDHGEAFGEHGAVGHGTAAHQEQLRVPLVLRGPGVPAGRRIAEPVSLLDVAPTLLELMGVPGLAHADGVSQRAALADAHATVRPLFFAWLGADARGVRSGPWKALGVRAPKVFDLRSDPHERTPAAAAPGAGFDPAALFAAHGETTDQRRQALAGGKRVAPAAAPAVSEEVERSLRALGYVH
jgi:arylsulfatase A-like enzyme